ncbi:hypothetical protein Daus18300_009631 [Diaporthe australafricana]|uniref:DASH complex subunit DAD2 n=1 Tax=Diaporthe australafricana TaxID=127596 RepID=A0ABR3WDN8_9PEZI
MDSEPDISTPRRDPETRAMLRQLGDDQDRISSAVHQCAKETRSLEGKLNQFNEDISCDADVLGNLPDWAVRFRSLASVLKRCEEEMQEMGKLFDQVHARMEGRTIAKKKDDKADTGDSWEVVESQEGEQHK